MKRILSGFGIITGALYPLRTLGMFIRHPHLWQYIIVPILVNCVVGGLLYFGLLSLGWEGIENLMFTLSDEWHSLLNQLPSWLSFLEYIWVSLTFILKIILVVILLFLIGFILVQFGVLLGAPWYGQLSEELEKILWGTAFNLEVGIMEDLWRAVLFELKKLVLMAIVAIPLLLIKLLPPIGPIVATIGWLTLAGTIICLDFFDAPLERRRYRFRRKLRYVYSKFPASASFSLVCGILISIPLVNLLTIPLCVASGTVFFCDRAKLLHFNKERKNIR